MKIGQYCQRQRCKHVESEQFWHAFASRGFVSDSWAFLLLFLETAVSVLGYFSKPHTVYVIQKTICTVDFIKDSWFYVDRVNWIDVSLTSQQKWSGWSTWMESDNLYITPMQDNDNYSTKSKELLNNACLWKSVDMAIYYPQFLRPSNLNTFFTTLTANK